MTRGKYIRDRGAMTVTYPTISSFARVDALNSLGYWQAQQSKQMSGGVLKIRELNEGCGRETGSRTLEH